jgi:hypothetical protein
MIILRQKEYSINPKVVEIAGKATGAGVILGSSALSGKLAGKVAEKKEQKRLKEMGIDEKTAEKLSKEKKNRVAGKVGTIIPTVIAVSGTKGKPDKVRIPIVLTSAGAGYIAGRVGAKKKKEKKENENTKN